MNSILLTRKVRNGALALGLCLLAVTARGGELTQYVDPLIGSAEHGHVFVGANVPFGFVQLGPTSIPQEWDWCSGYNRSDSTVIGFAHTHLSGTGCGDLHDITVMPVVGRVTYARGREDDPQSGLWSYQERTHERARAGYYATRLARYGIDVELTATARVGLHRYTFPASEESAVVFDLAHGGGWDRNVGSMVRVVDERTIEGYRFSRGWAEDERIHFRAEFSRPFSSALFIADGQEFTGSEAKAEELYFRAGFSTREGEQVLVKVALSATSVEGARLNMQSELPGWNFAQTVATADSAWEEQLQKIRITSADRHHLRTFYTAMFHTMVAPSVFSDVDGRYYGADHKVHQGRHTTYTTFSLWDTYRAAHPLMTIIHPERVPDIIATMLDIYDEQGKLPVWHLMGCETNCMVGYPAIPVVADAVLKGFGGFDAGRAYRAMVGSTQLNERGMRPHRECGYIPFDSLQHENVAYEMEYCLADWALAQVARQQGHDADYRLYLKRSQQYRTLFDRRSCFIRAKDSRGRWRTPFDPFHQVAGADDYCEGNAWQYTFLAPHDLDGLVRLFGSRKAFLQKLDSLFIVEGNLGEQAAPDITGLIGQYAHGNEPSHHIAYFYTMLGQPWKTADLVRRIMTELYTDRPDGLCGNEDVGQMSAWYILSALGFYQVEPAGGRYVFGSPLFPRAEVQVPGGTLTVVAPNVSDVNRYVREVRLNGHKLDNYWIDYADIMRGGTLEFVMSPTPDGILPSQRPAETARTYRSEGVEREIADVSRRIADPKLAWLFANCYPNTLDTTVGLCNDSDAFVYTGDIHAMWLRDASSQLWPYVHLAASDADVQRLVRGTLRRMFRCVLLDPYANAFNLTPDADGEWQGDLTAMRPELHERKWELDSPCYPVRLAHAYYQATGDRSLFDGLWVAYVRTMLRTFREQQRKDGLGPYRFQRVTARASDTQLCDGYGSPVNPVGLICSAFRPSDDATLLPFLVPSNFMAVAALRQAARIMHEVNACEALADSCTQLAGEVDEALRRYAVVEHPDFGPVYAYEVDGFGGHILMDDANIPSLLSLPYISDVSADDPVWQNTRRLVLSSANPYFFSGTAGEGIGGPHVGYDFVWPMNIMMRAMTSSDDAEIARCLQLLRDTDAGTGFMHESFHKDDASRFTRKWFAWQNSLFGELVLKLLADGKLNP